MTANVMPKAMVELSAAALRGDRAAVERLDAPLRGLHEALVPGAQSDPGEVGPGRAGGD